MSWFLSVSEQQRTANSSEFGAHRVGLLADDEAFPAAAMWQEGGFNGGSSRKLSSHLTQDLAQLECMKSLCFRDLQYPKLAHNGQLA